MRKMTRFVPLYTLISLVLLVLLLSLVLGARAPRAISGPMAGITIKHGANYTNISGHDLACPVPPAGSLDVQCTATIAEQSLVVNVSYANANRQSLGSCRARYGSTPVVCQATYGISDLPPLAVIEDTLGLDASQWASLQQQQRLANLGEYRWLQLLTGCAVLIAANVALVIWQTLTTQYRPAPQVRRSWLRGAVSGVMVLAGLGGGLATFCIVLVAGGLRLLTLGFID